MSAPKIYRYDDDNAPVTSGQAGSGIALLRACLVDGYGDKQPAGWSMPYCNAEGTKAAFRNNPETGTGFYLQADNPNNNMRLQGYENMTDEATGVKPFTDAASLLPISNQAGTTPRPWLLVADDRFFLAVVWTAMTISAFDAALNDRTASHGYVYVTLFGDGIPLSGSDAYFCLFFRSATTTFNTALDLVTAGVATSSGMSQYVARNAAGTDAVTSCGLVVGGGPLYYSSNGGVANHANLPARVPGHEIVSRPYVNNGAAYTMRGYVPGLWHSCHKYTELDQFEIIEIGGHRFMVIKISIGATDSYRNHILVDISEHWRP